MLLKSASTPNSTHRSLSCKFSNNSVLVHRGRLPAPSTSRATDIAERPLCRTSTWARAPRGLNVVCMAHPRRMAKVAAQIQREIGDMFIRDEVVQNAICPERATGMSDQLSAVASVTHVYVSNDLQVVKIYVSIYSDEQGKIRAMNNLKKLEKYVRREIGQRVTLRLTPEIRFEYDDSLDEMELVQKVIGEDEIKRYERELAIERGETPEEEEPPRSIPKPKKKKADSDDGFLDGVGDSDADAGFFDVEDEEVEEEDAGKEFVVYSSADVFNRPGPFDDLFTGDGEALIQPRPTQRRKKGGPKGGKVPVNS